MHSDARSTGDKWHVNAGESANRFVFFLFQASADGQKENRMESVKPLLCSIPDAAGALSISRSKTYELISQGVLLTVTIGRRRLVRLDSVNAIVYGEAA